MKKGFSLIELIAVIALLGVLITLTSISVTSLKRTSEEKLLNEKIKYIETGALKWGEDNLNLLSSNSCYKNDSSEMLTVQVLIAGGYITGDDNDNTKLKIPGTNEYFNDKCVCVKYENIYSNKNLDDYASSYNYESNKSNYQVTASYGEGKCE